MPAYLFRLVTYAPLPVFETQKKQLGVTLAHISKFLTYGSPFSQGLPPLPLILDKFLPLFQDSKCFSIRSCCSEYENCLNPHHSLFWFLCTVKLLITLICECLFSAFSLNHGFLEDRNIIIFTCVSPVQNIVIGLCMITSVRGKGKREGERKGEKKVVGGGKRKMTREKKKTKTVLLQSVVHLLVQKFCLSRI